MPKLPPLSLYIHIPWCIQKCPYCDFNSHTRKAEIPQDDYIQHLLNDLSQDQQLIGDRQVLTLFIGGGTPSLFSATAIYQLLKGIKDRINLSPKAEITMEANPGTVETSRFQQYQQAGITRISIGIQSFDDQKLQQLGRIHDAKQAKYAAAICSKLNLASFNLDLMHGLPEQTLSHALADLRQAIALAPPHLSWYQLTIEPNTLFGSKPPKLPDEDILWEIYQEGDELLRSAGYQQYEISAYAKPGYQCQHNLNYWRFGDYLAIGCGAHSKITLTDRRIIRMMKTRHPKGYMAGRYLDQQHWVSKEERPFEFFMNRFRLLEPTPRKAFSDLTNLNEDSIRPALDQAISQGYIVETSTDWQITNKGKLFLNSLLELFL